MLHKLSFRLNDYAIDIPLTMLNNVILGAGNVGKTCLFKKLQESVNNKKIEGKFLFIDLDHLYNISLIERVYSDYLVIIDQFDAVRVKCPEIIGLLNKYKPQTLIFGRDVFDLPSNKHFVYFAECDDVEKRIKLRPLLPDCI